MREDYRQENPADESIFVNFLFSRLYTQGKKKEKKRKIWKIQLFPRYDPVIINNLKYPKFNHPTCNHEVITCPFCKRLRTFTQFYSRS